MTDRFAPFIPGSDRIAKERARVEAIKRASVPPAAMRAAPDAPARGVMMLVPNYEILPGGTRRQDGARWLQPMVLDVENLRSVEAARKRDADVPRTKAEVFTPGQIAMAARYRDLVEWIAAAGFKCSRLERGVGGRASNDYMETYGTRTSELVALRSAIGDGVILEVTRRNRGELRDRARKPLTVRAAVDGMILDGLTLSRVITRHGWAAKWDVRRQVRDAIRGALNRMQDSGGRDATK